jgi:VWFA-related protein
MRIEALVVAGLALSMGVATAAVEPPRGQFGAAVDVHEIELDFRATDREGWFVDGLEAKDLRLWQDGAPVEITGLRRVRGGAVWAAGEPEASGTEPGAPPAREPLHLAIFVDNLNLAPNHRSRALGQLWSFLDGRLTAADRVLVASYDGSLRVVQPFTSDGKRIVRALREVDTPTLAGPPPRSEERALMEFIHQKHLADLEGLRQDPCTIIESLARNFAAQRFNDVRRAGAVLEGFVAALTGLPGRKAIVHVSDGIPMIAGLAPLSQVQELCDGSGVMRGVPGARDIGFNRIDVGDPNRLLTAMASYNSASLWSGVAASANLRGVTFYTVHAAGLESPAGADASSFGRFASLETLVAEQRNRLDPLAALAEDTGGRALLNQNDLTAGFEGMLSDLRDSYVLTFRPSTGKSGEIRKLRLETTRDGVTLRYRKSFRFRTRHEQVADRLVGAVLHDSGHNPHGLGLAAQAGKRDGEGSRSTRLRLIVPIDRLTLVSGDLEAQAMFTVFVAVLRGDGIVTPVRQTTIPLRVPIAQVEEARRRTYVHEIELALPAGEHVLGLGVLDELEGSSSFLRQKLKL